MATANHVLLRRITLSASAASVTFDNIPQTGYTDLKIVFSVRSTDDYLNVSFNGLTTNLSSKTLGANSAGPFSISASNGLVYGLSESNSWTANTFNNAEMYIPNYTSSNAKSWSVDAVTENNGTAITLTLAAGLWNSAAAITSISFNQGANNILAGSSFSLYGIANAATTPALAPKADGGDIIKTDGTYWYHAFLASGVFKPQVNLTADILQIAGGGGGAGYGGGGGAGGLLGFTSQSLSSTSSYTCTVGAGGTKTPYNTANIGLGNNSQFASLTASVGGGGGGSATNYRTGGNGGSGGGGGSHDPGNGTASGGTGTSGQGNAGGSGTSQVSAHGGGGGGGAGAAGASTTGIGGVGVSTYSSWGAATGTGQNVSSTYYFAGGGTGHGDTVGPNAGGYGGGGSGGYGGSGSAGTMGTGGGGGSWQGDGGNGGSGIIIIRYPV